MILRAAQFWTVGLFAKSSVPNIAPAFISLIRKISRSPEINSTERRILKAGCGINAKIDAAAINTKVMIPNALPSLFSVISTSKYV